MVIAWQFAKPLLDGPRQFANVRNDARKVAALDIAERDNAPLNMLSIERIWARRIQYVDHFRK